MPRCMPNTRSMSGSMPSRAKPVADRNGPPEAAVRPGVPAGALRSRRPRDIRSHPAAARQPAATPASAWPMGVGIPPIGGYASSTVTTTTPSVTATG